MHNDIASHYTDERARLVAALGGPITPVERNGPLAIQLDIPEDAEIDIDTDPSQEIGESVQEIGDQLV